MIGMVLISGSNVRKPSMADATEIGGVIIPSASKVLPPMMAGNINHFILAFLTSAYNAKIPPSPLLSARNVKITYFTVVCKVSVQKIQDSPPKMVSA